MIRSSSSLPPVEVSQSSSEAIQPPLEVFQVISAAPLDMVELLRRAHHPAAGAVVLFSGEVRDHNKGRAVDHLEYEAYQPLAVKMIHAILAEATAKWSLQSAIAQHRVGRLAIGESAVVVITAAAHRREAYEANRHIIDRIKHEVPIWKCEYFHDGSHQWGNNCNC
ncbi:molybdenum cofactor biosynthesis protein MoaE [Flavitalea sp. BT771]|uniref:molybdenum cofactor biosynthesis protein MoaE n=1 Tax=Flavitalea sp. BT771 TaxID=3063329 RepID=UPI0026E28A20|nr:molybdenum cofactor biosynthesis protein MoaE [Flavitalea sp. BT771]MDO6431239.1 molybdenum cofactor biosynthesis protein MoaE [Flavitalea sp. BT771]MDV6220146.1 molybdenum cofactor biosynthesis protein MoaE [Flavitalea sp. BT771]